MDTTTVHSPYGIHEKSHNRIHQALEELRAVLSQPVTIPSWGDQPARTFPFDPEKASGLIKIVAREVVEVNLRLTGADRDGQVSVTQDSGGELGVYGPDTVQLARQVMQETQWSSHETRYFERRNGTDSQGHELLGVSPEVSSLLTRVARDQDANVKLAQAREAWEQSQRARTTSAARRFTLDGLDPIQPENTPAAPSPSGRVVASWVPSSVKRLGAGIFTGSR